MMIQNQKVEVIKNKFVNIGKKRNYDIDCKYPKGR